MPLHLSLFRLLEQLGSGLEDWLHGKFEVATAGTPPQPIFLVADFTTSRTTQKESRTGLALAAHHIRNESHDGSEARADEDQPTD